MRIIQDLLIDLVYAEQVKENARQYLDNSITADLALETYDLAQATYNQTLVLIIQALEYQGQLN